jgi:hypothetical protein
LLPAGSRFCNFDTGLIFHSIKQKSSKKLKGDQDVQKVIDAVRRFDCSVSLSDIGFFVRGK